MRNILFALVLVLWFAGSGLAGTVQVTCATSTTSIVASAGSRALVAFQSTDTTNPVWICHSATCTTTTGWELRPGTANAFNSLTLRNAEARGAFSCIATGSGVFLQ